MQHDVWREEVASELSSMRDLLDEYDDLLSESLLWTPDKVQLAAIGSVLHSFVNGVENVFARIAKRVDGSLPSGAAWHQQLLDQMATPRSDRNAVLPTAAAERLRRYLAFRHAFRHMYVVRLDWGDMRPLVEGLNETWSGFSTSIRAFIAEPGTP